MPAPTSTRCKVCGKVLVLIGPHPKPWNYCWEHVPDKPGTIDWSTK